MTDLIQTGWDLLMVICLILSVGYLIGLAFRRARDFLVENHASKLGASADAEDCSKEPPRYTKKNHDGWSEGHYPVKRSPWN